MNKIVRFLTLLTIVSLSCNFLTGAPTFVEVSGPIMGVRTAASLDDQGGLVDPAYSFAPTVPQITVAVQVGALDSPAPLSVIWYRVNDQGDEKLFEHTIQVEPFDLGYSVGLNPDLLAGGTYKAVAALGEETQTVTWIVAEEQAQPEVGNPANASATSALKGAPPVSGASGKIPPSQRASGGTPPAVGTVPVGCTPTALIWETPPTVSGGGVLVGLLGANNTNPCDSLGKLEMVVWIGNSSPKVVCSFTGPEGSCNFSGDPCLLDGGSDLPIITKVNADLREKQTGKVLAQQTLVLGKDTIGPEVTIDPRTDPAKKVKAGDLITLKVTATEVKGAATWQTGVQEIQMTGPVHAPDGAWTNSSRVAQACNAKTWSSPRVTFTYEVPPNLTEIKLCVLAKDYADNYNKRDDCITYHTGDQLKGTLDHNMQQEGPSGDGRFNLVYNQDADLSLTLEPGGALSGTAQIDYSMDVVAFQSESCGSTHEWVDPTQLTLAVTGTWTEDAVDFHYTADAPIMVTRNHVSCGGTLAQQFDVSYLVGLYYHAAWDGQAYTADETLDCTEAAGTCEWHWTIHLAPPAPAVGFSPGEWAAANVDQASVDLTYP